MTYQIVEDKSKEMSQKNALTMNMITRIGSTAIVRVNMAKGGPKAKQAQPKKSAIVILYAQQWITSATFRSRFCVFSLLLIFTTSNRTESSSQMLSHYLRKNTRHRCDGKFYLRSLQYKFGGVIFGLFATSFFSNLKRDCKQNISYLTSKIGLELFGEVERKVGGKKIELFWALKAGNSNNSFFFSKIE